MGKQSFKFFFVLGAAVVAIAAFADWQSDYENGLKAARNGEWSVARDSFVAALASRADDSNTSTRLPGPITEPRYWRNGSLYSPNFAAAYAAYQMGKNAATEEEKSQYLSLAANEMQSLIQDKNQISPELLKSLGKVYDLQGDKDAKAALKGLTPNWKVDASFVQPEDQATGASTGGQRNTGGSNVNAPGGTAAGDTKGQIIKVKAGEHTNLEGIFGEGPVTTVETKYALIIGNSKSADKDAAIPFAGSDAEAVRGALTQFGGYEAEKVVTLIDVTANQIRSAAKALAESIPNDATVVIYFTGVTAHLGGRDYLAGVDAEFHTDTSKMVEKMDILRPLSDKGASIYMFTQSNRTMEGGNYFGQERLMRGTVSEAYATIPGGQITSIVTGGKQIGLYTYAFTKTLQSFFTNEVPISDFCWNVFYTMRRGSDSASIGGSVQTPTLPVLTNMARDSRF
ncbi:MAG: caspase family protein [Fimbriimonadaceae bacterium]|nr:caspase family protein [Fimbriimonadaceae bacterium]